MSLKQLTQSRSRLSCPASKKKTSKSAWTATGSPSPERRKRKAKGGEGLARRERSYGSFYRSMTLPFSPADGAVEAHLDKGVLHVTVKKPVEAVSSAKTIEIKPGEPPKQPA